MKTKLKLVAKSAQIKVGDLIRFKSERSKRAGFGLVIRDSRHDNDGFYYIRCDSYGRILYWLGNDRVAPANYVCHSNMLLGDKVEVIRTLELTTVDGMPSCGIAAIDAYLALVDGRYNLFIEHATPEQVSEFYYNEDRNYHTENSVIISKWYAQYLQKQA